MIIMVHVLFAIAGLMLYVLASGKMSEVGRIIFWTAFLALMLRTGSGTVHLF